MIEHLQQKIQSNIQTEFLDIINESHQHAGPAVDSHFKVIIVSNQFTELSLVKRHQCIYKILQEELAGPIHALAIHAYSPEQWKKKHGAPSSPACLGKN